MLFLCEVCDIQRDTEMPYLRWTPSMSWVIFRVTAYLARRQFRRARALLRCCVLASAPEPKLVLRALLWSEFPFAEPFPEPFVMLTTDALDALPLILLAAMYSSKVSKFCTSRINI